jgi:hypothetical protein
MAQQMRNMPDLLHWRCLHLKFSNPLHCHVFFTGEQNLQSISTLSLPISHSSLLSEISTASYSTKDYFSSHFCTTDQALCAIDIVAPQMMHLRIPKTFTEWVAQPLVLSDTTYRVPQLLHQVVTKSMETFDGALLPPSTRCWNTQTENKIQAFTWIPSRDNR